MIMIRKNQNKRKVSLTDIVTDQRINTANRINIDQEKGTHEKEHIGIMIDFVITAGKDPVEARRINEMTREMADDREGDLLLPNTEIETEKGIEVKTEIVIEIETETEIETEIGTGVAAKGVDGGLIDQGHGRCLHCRGN